MSASLVPFPGGKLTYVLDTWPVMEWLKDHALVADFFDDLIERAVRAEIILLMSIVNLGEVHYSAAKKWGPERADEILGRVRELPITVISASDEAVFAAARLKAVYPISYADAFAASLAIGRFCPLITGDEEFRLLEDAGLIKVEWLRG
jgi:predicted nucleic acid-binding protein